MIEIHFLVHLALFKKKKEKEKEIAASELPFMS